MNCPAERSEGALIEFASAVAALAGLASRHLTSAMLAAAAT
jgi:hypothetical protein